MMAGTVLLAQGHQHWSADNGNGTYTNPLFYDEFSDPDIIRVGNDYYLAGTTMHSVPGLVILHSTDMVNWEFCSYCFDRFDFEDAKYSLRDGKEIYGQGIWAPCIRYANGKFYVFSNINGQGLQAYISDNPKGPWKHQEVGGRIYDLGVLFDDNGKIYAFHNYGNVKCTELKPDLSGPVEGTEKLVIAEGNAMGEGFHAYKIDGWYYIISADYSPCGRMMCARSRNVYGPYETCCICERESFGYSQFWQTAKFSPRVVEDGYQYKQIPPSGYTMACANIHQGGILQAADGTWWGWSMQDFNAVGRTTCLSPVTWVNGWPYFGLEKNLGRAPRTWVKPNNSCPTPKAPYERCDDFSAKTLKPIWQWNHNPDDKMWSLNEKKGVLRLHSLPAKQLLWARNSLTQRAIGPTSYATVKVDIAKLKDGDCAGLGIQNMPASQIGVVKEGKEVKIHYYSQMTNQKIELPCSATTIWFRTWGDYDKAQTQFSYSFDGKDFTNIGDTLIQSYQLTTFQGVRHMLYCYNVKGVKGGYADFDDFTVEEPQADRSKNIPFGKTVHFINLADGSLMWAMGHGLMHFTAPDSKEAKSKEVEFEVIDKGKGQVVLRCTDGRYVFIAGAGLSGDVRLTTDESKAERFMWQDMLGGECMLLSLSTQRYVGKNPKDGTSYAADYQGSDADRKNGCVFKIWPLPRPLHKGGE